MSTIPAFPNPDPKAIIFDDPKVYACLASHPLTKGHTVVVWKQPVADLHLLKRTEYDHLMEVVDRVRNALLATLKIDKVYLMYLDEAKHVHWHLVPRYNVAGYNLLKHKPGHSIDYRLVERIRRHMKRLL